MLLRMPGSGFLAYGSSYSLRLPSRTTSGFSQVSSPFTVAGQHRTCTGFSVLQGVQVTTCTSTSAIVRWSSGGDYSRVGFQSKEKSEEWFAAAKNYTPGRN